MEILSIMNGAADPEIREKIKRFALLKGFFDLDAGNRTRQSRSSP